MFQTQCMIVELIYSGYDPEVVAKMSPQGVRDEYETSAEAGRTPCHVADPEHGRTVHRYRDEPKTHPYAIERQARTYRDAL